MFIIVIDLMRKINNRSLIRSHAPEIQCTCTPLTASIAGNQFMSVLEMLLVMDYLLTLTFTGLTFFSRSYLTS